MAGDWPTMPLEECMAAIIDYRGKSPDKTAFGIPLVTAKIIKAGRIARAGEFISEADYDAWMRRGIPQAGDVVMTTEAPLGEVAQLDGTKIALAQRVITLRGKPGILDNTFLKFLLQSKSVQEELYSRATGTTVLGIRQSELRRVRLPLPPFSEQQAIGELLGSLDDKIELNRRINETLETMARALFKSWFIDFDPVRAKADGRKPEGLDEATAMLFPDSFEESELGTVPRGWQPIPFLELADLLSGGTPSTSNAAYWDGPIPWASAKDVSQCRQSFLIATERSITRLGLSNSATKIIPKFSTVVVARGATTGRFTMFGTDIAMNQTCYGLRSRDSLPFFLNCCFHQLVDELVHSAHGSVFDTITTDTFRRGVVIAPGLDLRTNFEAVVDPLFRRILASMSETRTLATLRDALLPKLLSGELRIKDTERFVEAAL